MKEIAKGVGLRIAKTIIGVLLILTAIGMVIVTLALMGASYLWMRLVDAENTVEPYNEARDMMISYAEAYESLADWYRNCY